MDLLFATPSDEEFKQICDYIQAFELDNRGLKKEEFCIAIEKDSQLLGFGRLRQHVDCVELCSLGVLTAHRDKGIGKALTNELIKKENGSIYLVCIIPDFFTPFGFRIVNRYPMSMQQKLDYCIHSLVVPETYVVMCLQR